MQPQPFNSATEASNYAKEHHNLAQRGYTPFRGSDVLRMLNKGTIKTYMDLAIEEIGKGFEIPQTLPAVSESAMREFRSELRKVPAWKLKEAYNKLKERKPTGIPTVDKYRVDNFNLALSALNEALWERGMLPRGELRMVPQVLGSKFPLGQLVMTRGVADKVATDAAFAAFALESLKRHANGDWGDLCEEDKKENAYALDKHLRLFSAYDKYPFPKIWIITEADRSVTTTLLPEEY